MIVKKRQRAGSDELEMIARCYCWEEDIDKHVAGEKAERFGERPNRGQERLGTSFFGRKILKSRALSKSFLRVVRSALCMGQDLRHTPRIFHDLVDLQPSVS